MDYNKPGHPSLALAQMSLIQRTLARVKSCQRPRVRYGVFGLNTDDLILFFAVPPGQGTHPFYTANEVEPHPVNRPARSLENRLLD